MRLKNLGADAVQRGHARPIISFSSRHAIYIATWLVPSRPSADEPTILALVERRGDAGLEETKA